MGHRVEGSHWGGLQLSLSLVGTKVGAIWDMGNKVVRSTEIKLQLKCGGVYRNQRRVAGELCGRPPEASLRDAAPFGGGHSSGQVQARVE